LLSCLGTPSSKPTLSASPSVNGGHNELSTDPEFSTFPELSTDPLQYPLSNHSPTTLQPCSNHFRPNGSRGGRLCNLRSGCRYDSICIYISIYIYIHAHLEIWICVDVGRCRSRSRFPTDNSASDNSGPIEQSSWSSSSSSSVNLVKICGSRSSEDCGNRRAHPVPIFNRESSFHTIACFCILSVDLSTEPELSTDPLQKPL
jgi:hypothetical protein